MACGQHQRKPLYAERYDSHHGTGLIPASAPMMEEIADFWRDYFGIGR
jgi:hypothetical protein